ncbi:MAG: phage protein GemA/Gp16 family protein [bacterium]
MENQLMVQEETKNVPTISEDYFKDLIVSVGTLIATQEQQNILFAPIDEELVEIRPDGLIYLPWMEYVSRLKKTFGLEWGIVPKGNPQIENDLILWGFYLVVQGKLMGFAYGEQQYQSSNPQMTYGDALEGAKSNAIMRLCKGIGIGLELWQPTFIRRWKEKYAESYIGIDKKTGKEKVYWRKKGENDKQGEIKEVKYRNTGKLVPKEYWQNRDSAILGGESFKTQKGEDGKWYIWEKEENTQIIKEESNGEKPVPKSFNPTNGNEQIKTIHTLVTKLQWSEEEYRDYLHNKYNVGSSKDLNDEQRTELIKDLSAKMNEKLTGEKTKKQNGIVELTEWQEKIKNIPKDLLKEALKRAKITNRIDTLSDDQCNLIWELANQIADEIDHKNISSDGQK